MAKRLIIVFVASIFFAFLGTFILGLQDFAKPKVTDDSAHAPDASIEKFANETIVAERRAFEEQISQTGADSHLSPGTLCDGNDASNFDCYERYFRDVAKNKGINAAFEELRTKYAGNPYIRSQCHPLTHIIGQVASEKYKEVGQAFAEGDSFCWSGYYHGVMEGIIGAVGREKAVAQLNSVCTSLAEKGRYNFDHYNCVHGLGHGLMAITNDELFESLDYCGRITDAWESVSCASGVFMENIIVDGKNHFTKYLKSEDPLYPCNAVSSRYKGTCYLMQTSYMLKVTGRSFPRVFELCAGADEGYVDTCYQSLGRDASGQTISNVEQTKNICFLGKGYREQSNCIIGAVKDFISYFHSDTQARELCGLLAADLKEVCAATTESYYKIF